MSLYPSLEDLKVDKVIQAQNAYSAGPAAQAVLVDVSASFPPDGSRFILWAPGLWTEIHIKPLFPPEMKNLGF